MANVRELSHSSSSSSLLCCPNPIRVHRMGRTSQAPDDDSQPLTKLDRLPFTDELDHLKIDLDDAPTSSSSKPTQLPIVANRSIQTSKINFKLEYYLTLVRSSRGAALLRLIDDLLASDGVFVFSELLESQPIKELATHPSDSKYYELLEIFAYGTWREYRERQDRLPKLNKNQTRKLKLLSLIYCASNSRIIPYSELLEELEISETQELEELTIEGIYSNIMKGRLDQRYSRLEVESCMGRDVRLKPTHFNSGGDVDMDNNSNNNNNYRIQPNTVAELQSKLVSWSHCIAQVLGQLDLKIEQIREKERIKVEHEAIQTAIVESLAKTIYSNLSSSPHRNNPNASNRKSKEKEDLNLFGDHSMDIDDHDLIRSSTNKTRKRTRP